MHKSRQSRTFAGKKKKKPIDMKTNKLIAAVAVILAVSCGNAKKNAKGAADVPAETAVSQDGPASVVYFTKEITPESLVKIYKAVGREATGKVAVKISTGEMGGNNYLKPALIEPLLQEVNGRLVECNTAYAGSRMETADHRKTIEAHGFKDVDIMDEEGEIKIPVKDDKWIKYDIVGSHIQNYDFMINLAHFKNNA